MSKTKRNRAKLEEKTLMYPVILLITSVFVSRRTNSSRREEEGEGKKKTKKEEREREREREADR
jgi:hypothetical protein